MAQVISIADVVSARRRTRQREVSAACARIVEANLRLAMYRFGTAPAAERPIRARQVRQLAELLEYVTTCV